MTEFDKKIAAQEAIIEQELEKERKRVLAEIARQEAERKRLEEEAAAKQTDSEDGSESDSTPKETSTPTADVDFQPEVSATGFRWPLNISGKITSYFGKRNSPTAGASSYHQGIDISATTGTPIVAAKAGTVVTAAYQAAAGNYVMVHHGGDEFSVYMHCSKLNTSVGKKVTAGQVIAYVGSTGVSTGPHLHFGISKGGSYVEIGRAHV